jgi:hypothetical protein
LNFAPHWDAGAQQIGPVGPLSDGSGLRLVSGLGIGTATLEEDRRADATHDTGGLR